MKKTEKKFLMKTVVISKNKILIFSVCFVLGAITFLGGVCVKGALQNTNIIKYCQNIYKFAFADTMPSIHISEEYNILEAFFDVSLSKRVMAMQLPEISTIDLNTKPVETAKAEQVKTIENKAEKIPTPSPTSTVEQEQKYAIEDVNISKASKENVINSDKAIAVNNSTKYTVNVDELINKKLNFKEIFSKKPSVLIVHTHTTESYSQNGKNSYDKNDNDRSLDANKNMVRVGNAIEDELKKAGIAVVHDKTVHDYPSYTSAYQNSLGTIESNLKKYPSIQIVLDIHRDGLVRSDGTKLRVATDIKGVKTAQVMLVVGSDGTGLEHKNWRDNLCFALKLQRNALNTYPGLMRPIDLRKERFNEHMTKGSLIIEVGSNGNSIEEAIQGGKDIANVMSDMLKKN